MANTNSAKVSSEKNDSGTYRVTALTFTEVPSTQEVDTNHGKNHNCDIDGQVVGLIPFNQLLSVGNHLFATHVGIPVCD